MTDARARLALLAILVVAFALRLPDGAQPPGLYRDEAWYGMDAAATSVDGPSLWYPANNGREPLFIWLAAGFVALLGRTPAAVRLPAGLSGVLMVAAVYALTARLAGRRAALVAAALAAVAPWAVHGARTGFRAATLPALLAIAAAATARAAATGRRRHAAAAGMLGGLTLYTYTAARLAPLVVAAAWAAWRPRRGRRRRVALAWSVGAALVALPLALALATTPGALAGRAGQVAVWRTQEGGAPAAIAANARAVAGMVLWRGDANPRHNAVAGWPALRPPAGALWVVGCLAVLLGLAGRGRLGRPAAVALAAWAAALAVPTVLAEDAPHFLRGIGLQPLIWVTAGIGAGSLHDALVARWPGARRGWAAALAALAALAVAAEGRATLAAIDMARESAIDRSVARAVVVPPHAPGASPDEARRPVADPYFAFDGGAVDLALAVDRALGAGWRGGWAAGPAAAEAPARPVWLDRRLRDGWATVPFLVPIDRLTLTDPYDPVLRAPDGIAFLVPYGLDLARVWAERPPTLTLRLTPGAFERGDLAPEPTRMWVALERLAAHEAVGAPLATYANGMVLEWARIVPRPASAPAARDPRTTAVVELAWRLPDAPPSGEPRVVVAAALDAAADARALFDGPLGGGVYPATVWRAGDRLVERVPIDADIARGRDRVSLRVVEAGADRPTAATDAAGAPIAGALTIRP